MGKVNKTDDDSLHPHEILRQNLTKSSAKIGTRDGKVKKKAAKKYIHKCKFCEKKFTDKYNRRSHELLHSDDFFPCPLCSYKGKTKKYLARHHKQVHCAPEHKCHVCDRKFHHQCDLAEHFMVHTGEKPHKCEVCGKTFRVTYSLNSHMLIHKNEKPFKCSFCEYACRDSSTLRKHEHRHMGVVKMFTCKICTKKFPSKAKLKYHISEIHLDYLDLDLKRASCEKCNRTFKSTYNLNKHIQAVHEKSLSCSCPVCGRRLSNKQNLPKHLRTHFDERPHACAHLGCGKKFKDKGSLKKHSIIHSPHLHQPCKVCGATFSRARRLEAHMKTHEPRERSVECHYCGVTFYSKNYLIKHITQKHVANKKKFICDLCGLVTYNKPSIVMHLKYGHKHDNDIHCKICKTVYKRHEYLKAHYLRTHNVKYKPMKRRKRKDSKLTVEVKVEPLSPEPFGEIQLLTVSKEEIIDEEDPNLEDDLVAYSKNVLSEDLAECLLTDRRDGPRNEFDEFLLQHVFHKRIKQEDTTQDDVDTEQEALVAKKIKEIIKNTKEREAAEQLERRRKKNAKLVEKKLRREAKLLRRKRRREIYELEKVRQLYNERMRAASEVNKKEPAKTITYYKQKTTDNTNTDKQPDETNDNYTEENCKASNDDSSRNSNDSNDINNSSNENVEKVTDIAKNVSKTDKNKDSVNHNAEICVTSNITVTDSSNKDANRSDDVTDSNDMIKELNDDNLITDVNADDETNDKDDISNNNKDVSYDDKVCGSNDKNDGTNHDKNDDSRNDKVNGSNDEKTNDSIDDTDYDDAGSNYEPNPKDYSENEGIGNKRLKFKTYQCYICFKLYPTKQDLISHCAIHFPVCNSRTLAKCPVCGHVTHAHIAKHMFRKHGVNVTIPFNRITDRKDNTQGSRYCYKMDTTIMEIIPSVKILNHNAAIEIDKRNRERKDKIVAKTKLVKKGKEWIVENVAVDIRFEELPVFTEQELSKLDVTNSYADRLGQLNRLAKKKGIKILFPCDSCEKICQNLSALKLHGRRHDPNKKPFAPKKYKRNAKPEPVKKKPEVTNLENRLAEPKPIKNKHKCDDKLKEFYKTHIRGGDIEFWQFLKIFNKMDRENIQDFKDFEGRTEFGIHTNEDRSFNESAINEPFTTPVPASDIITCNRDGKYYKKIKSQTSKRLTQFKSVQTINEDVTVTQSIVANTSKMRKINGSKLLKKTQYKRVIMISKREQKEREKAKMRLREQIKQNSQ